MSFEENIMVIDKELLVAQIAFYAIAIKKKKLASYWERLMLLYCNYQIPKDFYSLVVFF